ncbi:MAG: hypothetical protein C0600_02545 [Ignavibacteria bacterium]|nr:MAG: hypothetical protein C0600_02545 [Ignavibacteria bacterium]
MKRVTILLVVLFGSFVTACGGERNDEGTSRQQSAVTPQAATTSNPRVQALQRADLGYVPLPDLKAKLLEDLQAISAWRAKEQHDAPIPRLITELYSLFNTLTVTARALDRDSTFATYILTEREKFSEAEQLRSSDAGRIMNGMTGTYAMYALLAKMKFYGQAEKQAEIQKIHDATVKTFKPEIPAVEAAAAISDACYSLTELIMEEIDSEGHFVGAFEHIERQYNQGVSVAKSEEDHFINGMFRTFEISQLWAMSLNAERKEDISKMNSGVSTESARAEDVGTQMAIAVKYLYLISFMIAEDTIELTL